MTPKERVNPAAFIACWGLLLLGCCFFWALLVWAVFHAGEPDEISAQPDRQATAPPK